MNIKKTGLLLLLICMSVALFAQKNMTKKQETFQKSILEFLNEEKLSPATNNAHNAINFQDDEGDNYWILVYQEDPFYVVFQRAGFSFEKHERRGVLLACNELNNYSSAIKAYCNDSEIFIVIEQFVTDAEDFKYVFYRNLELLMDAADDFLEYYNEFKN